MTRGKEANGILLSWLQAGQLQGFLVEAHQERVKEGERVKRVEEGHTKEFFEDFILPPGVTIPFLDQSFDFVNNRRDTNWQLSIKLQSSKNTR